ncbi:MAG TPA: DUF3800 domain-containing protein [Candidatus Acidoferrales bacterium]|nr:DUF3800 domain-containing protein [Candidatus Acidoferrales bacterium]
MLVFIDEAGDSGMKGKAGSSRLFVVTAVLFEENEDAEECGARISRLREELAVGATFEFHFNSCNDRFRGRFLEAVAGSNFFYHSIVLNKAKLWGEGFQNKESFYKYANSLVFENAKAQLSNAKVVLDECGNRDFKNQLAKYLKRKMNDGRQVLIRKVKMEPSHANNLLQLTDMICGAVYRSFDTQRENRMQFRRIVRHRELRVQVWPR